MNLVELIKLKNAIDAVWDSHADRQCIENVLMPVYSLISNAAFYTNKFLELEQSRQQWNQQLDAYHYILRQIISELDAGIKQHWPDMMQAAEENFNPGSDSLIKLNLDQAGLDFIDARLRSLGDWRKPGLIIRPAQETWIKLWVGFDPLYLADVDADLLKPAMLMFNALYQSKLRRYVIREPNTYAAHSVGFEPITASNDPNNLLTNLPQNQFDGCLAYNFFNYKKPSTIVLYLQSIFTALAPGGKLLCTINDCDRWAGAVNAENKTQSFTPLSWFLEQSQNIGYQLDSHHYVSASTTWIEIVKPGSSDPIKAGQTLAKILNKQVDEQLRRKYTSEETESLIEAAVNLNIDTAYNCRYLYTSKQLAKLIKRRMKQT